MIHGTHKDMLHASAIMLSPTTREGTCRGWNEQTFGGDCKSIENIRIFCQVIDKCDKT